MTADGSTRHHIFRNIDQGRGHLGKLAALLLKLNALTDGRPPELAEHLSLIFGVLKELDKAYLRLRHLYGPSDGPYGGEETPPNPK